MNKYFILGVLLAISGVSCSRNTQKPVVGLVMKSLNAEFFQMMEKGALAHARERGDLELLTVGTESQTELEKQIKLVEQLISRQVDAIVLVPIDSKALVPVAAKAIGAGIKVINIDIMLDRQAMAEQGIDVPFVGVDNEMGAKMVGDVLAKKLGKGVKVIIMEGVPGALNAQQRKAGFVKSIAENELVLLDTGVAYWETDRAATVFAELLAKHPDVQGVMCSNDAMALGVIGVLDKAGKAGTITVIGFDNDESIRPLIKEGKALATIDQFGSELASRGIDYAMRAIAGEPVTGWIKTPLKLITKEELN